MDAFFIEHKDLIAGFAAIGGAFSLLVAAVGLLLTAKEIRRSTRVSMASRLYEIQRDGREAATLLFEDKDTARVILNKKVSQDDITAAQIGRFFNFYAAVYTQFTLGVIDEQNWTPFKNELSGLAKSEPGRKFWAGMKQRELYGPAFTALVNGM